MKPIDFSAEALVFIHIPKTGGTSISEQLVAHLGEARCLTLSHGKVDPFRYSQFDEWMKSAALSLRGWRRGLVGRSNFVSVDDSGRDLSDVAYICGHNALGDEPDIGKRARYLSILRDPFDRLVSAYRFHLDRHALGKRGAAHPTHGRNGELPETVEEFFDRLKATGAKLWLNGQTRYFRRVAEADRAIQIIEETNALVAPLTEMKSVFEMLGHLVGAPIDYAHRNRTEKASVSPVYRDGFREEVAEAFAEDVALYRYAVARFADQKRRFEQEFGDAGLAADMSTEAAGGKSQTAAR